MIRISPTDNHYLIHLILSEPTLAKVTAYSGKPDKSFNYLLIESETKILGCFSYRHFSSETVECHIALLPEFWGQNFSVPACEAGFEWLQKNTSFKKVFTDVPVVCHHVMKLLQHLGMEICGMIKEGCLYNNKPTDLLLYDYHLMRNKND